MIKKRENGKLFDYKHVFYKSFEYKNKVGLQNFIHIQDFISISSMNVLLLHILQMLDPGYCANSMRCEYALRNFYVRLQILHTK